LPNFNLISNPPLEIRTRFLCPFFFNSESVDRATDALLEQSHERPRAASEKLWKAAHPRQELNGQGDTASAPSGARKPETSVRPHDLYREELLDHIKGFLFPQPDVLSCEYLTLSDPVSNRWFNNLEVSMPKARIKSSLDSLAGVELFLSQRGIGVLSIAFRPSPNELDANLAKEFNYRLSLLQWGNAPRLGTPHPSDDPERWNRISSEAKKLIEPAPSAGAQVSERLGRPGGQFTMNELVGELLRPLEGLGLRRTQDRLSVYTVARFGREADLASVEVRRAMAPFLSGLAEVEEAHHSGAVPGSISIANSLLNRRHWSGVGILGAAHVVADQPPPEESFNTARVPRVFMKYFALYLVALFQKLALHRTLDEASSIALSSEIDAAPRLADLRKQLLEFAVAGYFTQVSSRESLHRYYRTCQDGLGVHQALEQARQAIAEIDERQSTERQIQIATDMSANVSATVKVEEELSRNVAATKLLQERMTQHLDAVATVQRRLEVIEVVVISVYGATLAELVGKNIERADKYMLLIVLAGAVLGFVFGLVVIALLKHRDSTKR
jgi:hypothetical protein